LISVVADDLLGTISAIIAFLCSWIVAKIATDFRVQVARNLSTRGGSLARELSWVVAPFVVAHFITVVANDGSCRFNVACFYTWCIAYWTVCTRVAAQITRVTSWVAVLCRYKGCEY
jgi:phage-related holin